jgi:hypothetical protein
MPSEHGADFKKKAQVQVYVYLLHLQVLVSQTPFLHEILYNVSICIAYFPSVFYIQDWFHRHSLHEIGKMNI